MSVSASATCTDHIDDEFTEDSTNSHFGNSPATPQHIEGYAHAKGVSDYVYGKSKTALKKLQQQQRRAATHPYSHTDHAQHHAYANSHKSRKGIVRKPDTNDYSTAYELGSVYIFDTFHPRIHYRVNYSPALELFLAQQPETQPRYFALRTAKHPTHRMLAIDIKALYNNKDVGFEYKKKFTDCVRLSLNGMGQYRSSNRPYAISWKDSSIFFQQIRTAYQGQKKAKLSLFELKENVPRTEWLEQLCFLVFDQAGSAYNHRQFQVQDMMFESGKLEPVANTNVKFEFDKELPLPFISNESPLHTTPLHRMDASQLSRSIKTEFGSDDSLTCSQSSIPSMTCHEELSESDCDHQSECFTASQESEETADSADSDAPQQRMSEYIAAEMTSVEEAPVMLLSPVQSTASASTLTLSISLSLNLQSSASNIPVSTPSLFHSSSPLPDFPTIRQNSNVFGVRMESFAQTRSPSIAAAAALPTLPFDRTFSLAPSFSIRNSMDSAMGVSDLLGPSNFSQLFSQNSLLLPSFPLNEPSTSCCNKQSSFVNFVDETSRSSDATAVL